MADTSIYAGDRSALPLGFRLQNGNTGRSYQITKKLGQGGFGITYAGISLDNNSPIAIKEFFPGKLSSRTSSCTVRVTGDQSSFKAMLNSFYKEAKVLYELQGLSSVVKIYDYFYANNTAYYVMEYVSGTTLQQLLERSGPLNTAGYGAQFRQLMRDIEQLHRRGVIHRDISPDNIMVTQGGRFKLIDFGSARAYKNASSLTVNLKRDFAPIEQYSSKGQGAYTDVYSLAATMYYCFTGKLVPGAMDRDRKDTLLPPSAYGVHLSPKQEQALLKALAVKVSKRYQTMRDFEAAFFAPALDIPIPTGPEFKALSGDMGQRLNEAVDTLKGDILMPLLSGVFLLAAILVEIVL